MGLGLRVTGGLMHLGYGFVRSGMRGLEVTGRPRSDSATEIGCDRRRNYRTNASQMSGSDPALAVSRVHVPGRDVEKPRGWFRASPGRVPGKTDRHAENWRWRGWWQQKDNRLASPLRIPADPNGHPDMRSVLQDGRLSVPTRS